MNGLHTVIGQCVKEGGGGVGGVFGLGHFCTSDLECKLSKNRNIPLTFCTVAGRQDQASPTHNAFHPVTFDLIVENENNKFTKNDFGDCDLVNDPWSLKYVTD